MVVYAPGTEETDPKKQNISLQQNAAANSTNAANIVTNTANIATNTAAIAALVAGQIPAAPIRASLGADVALNNVTLYFDGPSIAQGTTGTWFVSGTVTVTDTGAAGGFFIKLWDGTTVISSTAVSAGAASALASVSLSGHIVSPAGNLRISCLSGAVTGKIKFNASGNSKDSSISAYRIA